MKKDYIAFIAGLPEIVPGDRKLPLSVADFREQAGSYIQGEDEALLNMLFLFNDNRQILRLLQKHEPLRDAETVYALNVLEEEVEEPEGRLPGYLNRFIAAFKEESLDPGRRPENVLSALYYDAMMCAGNPFLSNYAAFAMNLKNLSAALNCRKYDREVAAEIVGENGFAHALIDSHARDFGLSVEFPWVETVIALMDNRLLVERERGLDMLLWTYIEQEVTFDYFSIEKVMAFALELMIAERWSRMSTESGRAVFGEMVEKLRASVAFEKQFES